MIKKIKYSSKLKINSESQVNQKIIIPYLNSRKFKYERLEAKNSNGEGIPDFVIRWKNKFIFLEVKFGNNVLRPKQKQWFAKYAKDSFVLVYKDETIFIYDSKQILLLIKEGKL